ncbi:hypothetical protein Cfor_01050 [Coptotermes formosanus]|uniref:O-acyltransferase n=1 Tax=Coptotermes formosanus TaxID=36987 RepID=A0A6L2PAY4_COPFO|nr:hypothetical protein Cfor_01050 [Coptotermes formosanus]
MVARQQSGFEGEDGIRTRSNILGKDGVRNGVTASASTPAVDGVGPNAVGGGIMLNVGRKWQVMQDDLVETDEKGCETEAAVVQEMRKACALEDKRYDNGHKYKNRLNRKRLGGLAEKEFVPRNSLLTDLCEIKHIQTIYNIVIAILLVLFIHTAVYDLVVAGKLNLGIDLIQWNFQGLTTSFFIWLLMFTTTVLLFYCFKVWAVQRTLWAQNCLSRRCWDYGWLVLLVVYQTAFLCVLPIKIMEIFVPPASSLALLFEQIRFMMKSHAFVRSNVPRALAYKPHQSGDSQELALCPGFSKFLYFLFAPTLVYKDEYPRTKGIRWAFVVRNFMEVIGCIFYAAFIFERFLLPMYRDFGLPYHQNMPLRKMLVVGVFGSMIPGTFILVLAFYCLLHAWMNAFAELMHFADRTFYKDWWTASSQATYHRLWNIVVHDWLYRYVYRDFSEVLAPGKRSCQALVVFLISAIFHEYVLAFTFRFFYPMLFVGFVGSGGPSFGFLCASVVDVFRSFNVETTRLKM